MKKILLVCLSVICIPLSAARGQQTEPSTQKSPLVGERVPSEDPILKDFHSLGLIDGHTNIFRSACPVRDLAKAATTQPSKSLDQQANARMQRLYDLGIRTVISFQNPSGDQDEAKVKELTTSVAMEKEAAAAVGLRYVAFPMSNAGKKSLEEMSDDAVQVWLDQVSAEIFADARQGGVVFHCSAGHDRSGIVAAWLRIKYENWPVDEAIAEMRRLGHNWPKYSHNGGISSWHEDHLRALAARLGADKHEPINAAEKP
jgi:hypothetical protein